MLAAYRHLLNTAKNFAHKTEKVTWEALQHAVENAEQKTTALEILTEQEISQVQQDLKADLEQTAGYLTDFEQEAADFIQMEWHTLEDFLIRKSEELADPTDIMILKIRLMAAMEKPTPDNDWSSSFKDPLIK